MVNSTLKIFTVELIGTFVLVVFATGTVVYATQTNLSWGLALAAIGPFIALIFGVYSFGKISMAHFNPAVTLAFLVTGHVSQKKLAFYFSAELIGALLGSLFVFTFIGTEANLGANAPNYDFSMEVIFPIEVLASGLLMAVIYVVVYTKGLFGFSGIAIGGIVALDIFFLSFISGASMNPARAFAPAVLSGFLTDLWIYWTAPFIGTISVAFLFRKKLSNQKTNSIE